MTHKRYPGLMWITRRHSSGRANKQCCEGKPAPHLRFSYIYDDYSFIVFNGRFQDGRWREGGRVRAGRLDTARIRFGPLAPVRGLRPATVVGNGGERSIPRRAVPVVRWTSAACPRRRGVARAFRCDGGWEKVRRAYFSRTMISGNDGSSWSSLIIRSSRERRSRPAGAAFSPLRPR